ncbi:MAG: hypothetical protein ABSH20_10435, partial [Tepidisphaeraceae bacterium]
MRTRWVTVLALVVCSCVCAAMAQEKVQVKDVFAPGNYVMTVTAQNQGAVTAPEGEQKTREDSKFIWDLSVAPPGDKGEKKMTATLRQVRYLDLDEGKERTFDSEAAAEQN